MLYQSGVSLDVIQKPGGWKSIAMVERNSHLSALHEEQ
ncbi:MAG: site-specific integrase [Polynucleobacter sp.]|nr:site-specific integrase [Polynucleobacter sp.]